MSKMKWTSILLALIPAMLLWAGLIICLVCLLGLGGQ